MQDYTYSVFSIVAIAIHLIINFNLLLGRGIATARGVRYRGFLRDAERGLSREVRGVVVAVSADAEPQDGAMVLPVRERPGRTATAWAIPMTKACQGEMFSRWRGLAQ